MFDISLGEIAFVGLAGFLLLGPKDLYQLIRTVKNLAAEFKSHITKAERYLAEELETDDFVKIILDENGTPQKVYDVERIKPYIKPSQTGEGEHGQ